MAQGLLSLPALAEALMNKHEAQCLGSAAVHSPDFGIAEELAARFDLFRPGALTILGGRPAMGKTALMLQLAWYAAMAHKPTYIVELRDPDAPESLVLRSFSNLANVRIDFLNHQPRWEQLSRDDLARCRDFVRDLPLWVCGRLSALANIPRGSVVFVDTVQYVKRKFNWKRLAEKNGISLILLSNLTRSCEYEYRADYRPGPRDLLHARDVGRQADVSLFLFRENYYFYDSYAFYNPAAKVYAYRKSRGKPETVPCLWDSERAIFVKVLSDMPDRCR